MAENKSLNAVGINEDKDQDVRGRIDIDSREDSQPPDFKEILAKLKTESILPRCCPFIFFNNKNCEMIIFAGEDECFGENGFGCKNGFEEYFKCETFSEYFFKEIFKEIKKDEELINDTKTVINFLEGETPRNKIINYIKEYILKAK